MLKLFKFHCMVFTIPLSKFSSAFQPSSFSILLASIAYLLSCPALSSTNATRSLYEKFGTGFSLSKMVVTILTISRLVFSFRPPILHFSHCERQHLLLCNDQVHIANLLYFYRHHILVLAFFQGHFL